jgi:hypothetical protein
VQIPDEVLDKGLKPSEFYLLAVLYRHANVAGVVELTMESLSDLTGSSRTTIWRDMSGLESHGLIDTHRTKRNLGKFWKNKYQLLSPCFITETPQGVAELVKVDSSCFKTETSTDSNRVVQLTSNTKVKNTTYSLGADAPLKEVVVVNKWQDEDEGIGGWGLLEPAWTTQKTNKVSKRDPKTRHQRPQEEWTAADVASEFAVRVYDRVRGIPGLVSTKDLRGALSANRARFGVSATIEMELLEKFFGDERNITAIKNSPRKAHGIFLNFITANINSVTEEMGMDDEVVDSAPAVEYVYASDGKTFDNSMPGRKALEMYEEKLRRA